jgi:hypothetical protein
MSEKTIKELQAKWRDERAEKFQRKCAEALEELRSDEDADEFLISAFLS